MVPEPHAPHDAPRSPWLLYWVGRLYFWWIGWTLEGGPKGPNAVVLGVPHTSNWDTVHLWMASWVFRVRLSWIGKHTLFEPAPVGWFMRLMGGVPIDRRSSQGLVEQMAERFREGDGLYVCVPPAGTRGYTEYWKSGFYWIAREAGVPIILGFLDYERKVAGLGPAIETTGDLGADMDRIRAFYEGIEGKYPEQKSRIRLKAEDLGEGSEDEAG